MNEPRWYLSSPSPPSHFRIHIEHDACKCCSYVNCVRATIATSLTMFSLNVHGHRDIGSSRSVHPPLFRHVPIVLLCARFTVNSLYHRVLVTMTIVWGDHRELRYYARRRDHHLLLRCTRIRPNGFNGLYNIHTLDDFAKHDMPPIEPPRNHRRDEELLTHCVPRSAFQMHQQSNSKSYLRAICVGTSIGHREQPGLMML